jgi:predicted GNAT superfamily acetyltransferase
MGLDWVVWAFDPLQASNASFNLGVLGATSRTYEVDLYGPRTDALNVGLATDRLLVEWPTSGQPTRVDPDEWADAPELIDTPDHQPARVRLRIPSDLNALKAEPGMAAAWQQRVRTAFQGAFGAGYVALGFARGEAPAYLLERPA